MQHFISKVLVSCMYFSCKDKGDFLKEDAGCVNLVNEVFIKVTGRKGSYSITLLA